MDSIVSITRIEFRPKTGGSILLLDFGDEMDAEPDFSVSQPVSSQTPLGAAWAQSFGDGGAVQSVSFTRWRDHASHAAARGFQQQHKAVLPYGIPGTLRVSIEEGAVWDYTGAAVSSVNVVPIVDTNTFETLSIYRFSTGDPVPVSGLDIDPSLKFGWWTEPFGEIEFPFATL